MQRLSYDCDDQMNGLLLMVRTQCNGVQKEMDDSEV